MHQNVFISYRRIDSTATAERLFRALRSTLPPDIDVFFDVDDLDPGRPIPDKIRSALELSTVMLVVIGSKWVEIGRQRFDSENDLVRFELEYGLSLRRIRVIPLLVDGARMPTVADLPGRLKSFVYNEAVEISPAEFDKSATLVADRIAVLLRPSIRMAAHRDLETLGWDYVDLLRELILLDLAAVNILGTDEAVADGGDADELILDDNVLAVHPVDPASVTTATGRRYFREMRGKERVPFAATSRGLPYRHKVSAGGGVPPYTFTIAEGRLPPGLSFDHATGEIAGRPTAGGEYCFTVQVADAAGRVASRSFSINGDEGTPEDWARVFQDFPDTWRLILNKGGRILGYWHVAPLHDHYLEGVRTGSFKAGEVTKDKLKLFHMFPGTYDVFFVIVVLRKEYRIGESAPAGAAHREPEVSAREINDVHRQLFDSFFDALEELACRGVFVRELLADVWTLLGKGFFEHFGMAEVQPCPREDLVAMCAGRIETILGKHAKRYPHLIERYMEQMEDWDQDLFDRSGGQSWMRKLKSRAGGVPLIASGGR